MGKTWLFLGGVVCALVGWANPADAVVLLTHDKVLKLTHGGDPATARGVVSFGKDPALADAPDPSCPTASSFELGLYPVATNRVARGATLGLDCAKWRAVKNGWIYDDAVTTDGVRKIVYGPKGLEVSLVGAGVFPAAGPVGYVQTWFVVGDRRFHGRFHVFKKNEATAIASRKQSRAAARGEAGFWSAIWGDDSAEAAEQATLRVLQRATKRDRRDGRSAFLLAMLRLYRFGQVIDSVATADAAARTELERSVAAFDDAEPLLWNRATGVGDSRVPGFAAAARYNLALLTGDAALRARALDDLAYSIEINAFFNVFDLMVVAQAELPGTPAFQQAFDAMDAYLSDPETLTCVNDQPEVCGTAGFAPSGIQGALVLFGDLYAKAGDAARAKAWYTLASATESGWPFEGLAAARRATVAARVAAYQDGDPSNDPLLIGARTEACAACHNRPVVAP